MAPAPDGLQEMLQRYFANEGEFGVLGKRADALAKAKLVFAPYLSTLPSAEQRRLIRMVAETAVGANLRFLESREEALDILYYLSVPWPVDRRNLLLEAKPTLLREFGAEANLEMWASWDGKPRAAGPAYALMLYSILLAVSSDDELRPAIGYLAERAKHAGFREKLGRIAIRSEGTRLSSSRQFSQEEHVAWLLQEQRSFLRRRGIARRDRALP